MSRMSKSDPEYREETQLLVDHVGRKSIQTGEIMAKGRKIKVRSSGVKVDRGSPAPKRCDTMLPSHLRLSEAGDEEETAAGMEAVREP